LNFIITSRTIPSREEAVTDSPNIRFTAENTPLDLPPHPVSSLISPFNIATDLLHFPDTSSAIGLPGGSLDGILPCFGSRFDLPFSPWCWKCGSEQQLLQGHSSGKWWDWQSTMCNPACMLSREGWSPGKRRLALEPAGLWSSPSRQRKNRTILRRPRGSAPPLWRPPNTIGPVLGCRRKPQQMQ